ncbi:hypothetical protein C5167_020052 [Papaver somniferum]|uniref:Fe2OG dioxygenase domain-containing protein n=1 Tax=Papaver somniferum TaxID=3469 RepID=A0A4Y7ISF8_PAPSO|nr:hypothetical protein C5167_020052 [Papaver somniferum]
MVIRDFSSDVDINSSENYPSEAYDRMKELIAFDDTKAGVKGLIDAGIQNLPRIFHRPPADIIANEKPRSQFKIPTIDLGGEKKYDGEHRKMIVEQIRDASEKWGFFQVVNHGFPQNVMDEMTEKFRLFNEQPTEVKAMYYGRYVSQKPVYFSNFDLFQAPAANWRDSFSCNMAPVLPNPEDFPDLLREIAIEYSKYATKLGSELLEFLSEGLGLEMDYLNKVMDCDKGHVMVCHYYPGCPQPKLTMGTTEHSDPTFITLLLRSGDNLLDDSIGALQINYQNQWLALSPPPGSFIVNIGDMLQASNYSFIFIIAIAKFEMHFEKKSMSISASRRLCPTTVIKVWSIEYWRTTTALEYQLEVSSAPLGNQSSAVQSRNYYQKPILLYTETPPLTNIISITSTRDLMEFLIYHISSCESRICMISCLQVILRVWYLSLCF